MHSFAALENNNNSLNCIRHLAAKMDFEFITNETFMTYLWLNRLLQRR